MKVHKISLSYSRYGNLIDADDNGTDRSSFKYEVNAIMKRRSTTALIVHDLADRIVIVSSFGNSGVLSSLSILYLNQRQ